ncbi:hypothetical protein COOONC_12627 [Cooperia oncophora]
MESPQHTRLDTQNFGDSHAAFLALAPPHSFPPRTAPVTLYKRARTLSVYPQVILQPIYMFLFLLSVVAALCAALPSNREYSDASLTAAIKPIEAIPVDPFFIFNTNPDLVPQVNPIGQGVTVPKKTEKLPHLRPLDDDRPIPDVVPDSVFLTAQPGVAPQLTGSVATPSPADFEFFDFGENSGGKAAAVNPAATYLEGGDFEKITAPRCRMMGCTGPVPNDGSFLPEAPVKKGKACHQTFVPMNGCTDNKGYPMGMLCSICCECTKSFVREMRKTHGYKTGFNSS